MIVWVMVVVSYHYGAHSTVIDNIASEADCRRVAAAVVETWDRRSGTPRSAQCFAVRKVKP